jgi:hypothetical protein
MGLSLESIYQPFNDFFLKRFAMDDSSRTSFRFDKFGSGVSEGDFMDANHPELGYVPALAREEFSELVNRIPEDRGDGVNVSLGAGSVDDTYYHRLLAPSLPYVPPGADDATAKQITEGFGRLKAEAVKAWDTTKLESLRGLRLQYRPSLATPEEWYDSSKDSVWTRHRFEVAETRTSAPADAPSAPEDLWRLRPSDAVMAQVLQTAEPANRVAQLTAAEPVPFTVEEARAEMPAGRSLRGRLMAGSRRPVEGPDGADVALLRAGRPELHVAFRDRLRALSVKDRIAVKQYVEDSAPTRPAETSSISVAFDYCLVRVDRPWYLDAFVEEPWCVRARKQGALNARGDLTLLPIGFVAIRRLEIHANWTAQDLAAASSATDFGPFTVTPKLTDGRLSVSHPGLQIIGWLLHELPALPPHDGPGI